MTLDSDMRALAEGQHAAVARWQLHAAGADDDQVFRRAASGDWDLATPRVLRLVGSPRTPQQAVCVAVLDAGRGAVASHATAAALWRLPGFSFGPLEVTQTRAFRSYSPSVGTLHRPRLLTEAHVTVLDGIRVTTLARTLFDMAPRLHVARLQRVADSVVVRSPGTLLAMHGLLHDLGKRGRPGITKMRTVLAEMPPGYTPPASGLERRFEFLVERAGERALRRQVDVGGHDWLGRVDYLDDVLLIIFEIDSIVHHSSPLAIRRDAERDEALLAAGYRKVVRIFEEEIWYRPDVAVAKVRTARAELVTKFP
jgi:very-short-patch-repair endonuclease